MGQQSAFIYSFVARGSDCTVLAEFSAFKGGNVSDISLECLRKLNLQSNGKHALISADRHTFNYLVDDGFAFLVVADEALGQQVPMAALERIKNDFTQRYGGPGGRAHTAEAHSLTGNFGLKLKEHMQYCVEHAEEIDSLAKIKAQVTEVKGILTRNMDELLKRHVKLDTLQDKAKDLESQAGIFQKNAQQVRWKMWLQNMKVKLVVLGIIIILILIIWLSICKGFKCH